MQEPQCECGERLLFGSDPMTGQSVTWCGVCGEQVLPIHRQSGQAIYDQRPVLEQRLAKAVEMAQKPIQKRNFPSGQGDAWRDSQHKKGEAA
jgi:hypothetical protein